MSVSILTIDGGGMKGIVASIVLMRLEKYLKHFAKDESKGIIDYFDLVAGTSTGSILTGLLLCPDESGKPKYTPEDALELYINKGKEMFHKRPLYPVNTLFGLCKSKYTNEKFREGLAQYFGEVKISELLRPCMIVTYDMMSRKTLFINSVNGVENPARDIKVMDAVLASCSAPTYFPPVTCSNSSNCKRCMIDGGVAANNPAMSALIEGMKLPGANTINDTYLFSVGNLKNERSYSCEKAQNWGIAEFALPLLDIFMETSEEIVDYQVRKLYESRKIINHYMRIENVTTEEIPKMDDTSEKAIKKFITYGNELVRKEEVSIRNFAKLLVEKKQYA